MSHSGFSPKRPWWNLPVCLLLGGWSTPAILHAQEIEVAEDLFVDLDAKDPSAGTPVWISQGIIIEFQEVGDPVITDHEGAPGVSFNGGGTFDAYQSVENAPAGLVGMDATRTIEVWTYNPDIAPEETLVAWGKRGGPNGTNMSFNYGSHVLFSAIGHWGGEFPDIGWGPVPPAGQWHHLAYTYDGTITRVYQDGFISNIEYLGPGVINTHVNTKIALATQYLPDGVTLDPGGLRGSLSLGKVRIHDGVLAPEQILKNYFIERKDFPLPGEAPVFLNAPSEDYIHITTPAYTYQLRMGGFPLPTFEAVEPAGASVSERGLLTYNLPKPEPSSFRITLRARNPNGTTEARWIVTVLKGDQLQIAGELFVDLDAKDPSAGTAKWANPGSLEDLLEVGDPVVSTLDGAPSVSFNGGQTEDAYQSVEDAPPGLVDIDPTRTIEVWAFNPELAAEETMVSWGHRGGPSGSNMSFNFGSHQFYGAVTHWGGDNQDLGWLPSLPPAGQWNYLVYTYDGATTRVYQNGVEAAWEGLGPGQISTHTLTKITLGAQVLADATGPDFGPTRGTLSLGRVRVHDGVLAPAQILNNYEIERKLFPLPPAPAFTATPEEGTEPLRVSLDGSASTSPNGPITQYSWDFGDGETAVGPTLTHTFAKAGRYTVALTITDQKGADATTSKPVTAQFRSENVSPWTSVDIGDTPPLLKGGARPAAGACLEVYASGKDIGRTADQFHFVYQQLSGDATMVARVNAAEMPPNAKVGVMLREDLTPGSRFAAILLQSTGAGRYTFLRRETAGAQTRPAKNSTESFTLPNAWVRIQRQGGDFIGSWSADGTNWTELGRAAVALPDALLGGIAATAADIQGKYLALKATLCDLSTSGGTPPAGAFRRGDVDSNGTVDITDAVNILGYQFLGQAAPPCLEAADTDNSGTVDISDAISSLNYQFLGGPEPVGPGPRTCGPDSGAPFLGCGTECRA